MANGNYLIVSSVDPDVLDFYVDDVLVMRFTNE